MAYQFTPKRVSRSGATRGYCTDFAVGRGAKNFADDVMLVQRLFHMLYHENINPSAVVMPPPGNIEEITVTGFCGNVTHTYIAHFKQQLREGGSVIYPDEVLDPFRDNDVRSVGTISKTRYAFGFLVINAGFANVAKFNALPQDPDNELTKPALKSALTQTRGNARQYGG